MLFCQCKRARLDDLVNVDEQNPPPPFRPFKKIYRIQKKSSNIFSTTTLRIVLLSEHSVPPSVRGAFFKGQHTRGTRVRALVLIKNSALVPFPRPTMVRSSGRRVRTRRWPRRGMRRRPSCLLLQ